MSLSHLQHQIGDLNGELAGIAARLEHIEYEKHHGPDDYEDLRAYVDREFDHIVDRVRALERTLTEIVLTQVQTNERLLGYIESLALGD